MTDLRQGRWPQWLVAACGAPSMTVTAALGLGLLLPATAGAAPHSRAHRPLATALHSAAVTPTAAHSGAAKRAKAGPKAKTATTHAAGSGSAGEIAGRHGNGSSKRSKGRHAAPTEPLVPMSRAHREAAPLERDHGHGRGKTGSRAEYASGPAPLMKAGRRGDRAASGPVATRGSAVRYRGTADDRTEAHAQASGQGQSRGPSPHGQQDTERGYLARNTTPAMHSQVYAEGVSRPDDDERLPRPRTVPENEAQPTIAPVVRAAAAGPSAVRASGVPGASATTVPVAPPAVVQGFGSELAVPASAYGSQDRPGGTHRRNHPATWQPESMVTQPEPLDEREAVIDAAVRPAVLPEIYDRSGRLVVPAPLKGSHDVLVHQNLMASNDGLERIYDDADLDRLRAQRQLVGFPVGDSLRVNEELPYNRRVARPWTVAFATDIGHAFFERFHQPLVITSAARTVYYQARLQRVNGNAAATTGEAASPHLTGQAIDFGKHGMNQAELAWMRGYLLPLMQAGRIDVEEEFQQACFHISVYRSYAASRRVVREYAQIHAAGATPSNTPASVLPELPEER